MEATPQQKQIQAKDSDQANNGTNENETKADEFKKLAPYPRKIPKNVNANPLTANNIYRASYSGHKVWELEVDDVTCMRREEDSYINVTHLLKVAGYEKSKRTKILEKEVYNNPKHEKVQGGYGKYQGTWVPFEDGKKFAQFHGIALKVRKLFELDPNTAKEYPEKKSLYNIKRTSSLMEEHPRNRYQTKKKSILTHSIDVVTLKNKNTNKDTNDLANKNKDKVTNKYGFLPLPQAKTWSNTEIAPKPHNLMNERYFTSPQKNLMNEKVAALTPQDIPVTTRAISHQTNIISNAPAPQIDGDVMTNAPTLQTNTMTTALTPYSDRNTMKTVSTPKKNRMSNAPTPKVNNTIINPPVPQVEVNVISNAHTPNMDTMASDSTPRVDRNGVQNALEHPINVENTAEFTPNIQTNINNIIKSSNITPNKVRISKINTNKRSNILPMPIRPKSQELTHIKVAQLNKIKTTWINAFMDNENKDIPLNKQFFENKNYFQPNLELDNNGHTALHYAASMGRYTAIAQLINHGWDPLVTNNTGMTPLMRCVIFNHAFNQQNFDKILIQLSKSILKKDKVGRNVLHYCTMVAEETNYIQSKCYYINTLLSIIQNELTTIDPVTFVNLEDNEGNTPCHLAARLELIGIIKLLSENGADLHKKNNSHLSVLDYLPTETLKQFAPSKGEVPPLDESYQISPESIVISSPPPIQYKTKVVDQEKNDVFNALEAYTNKLKEEHNQILCEKDKEIQELKIEMDSVKRRLKEALIELTASRAAMCIARSTPSLQKYLKAPPTSPNHGQQDPALFSHPLDSPHF